MCCGFDVHVCSTTMCVCVCVCVCVDVCVWMWMWMLHVQLLMVGLYRYVNESAVRVNSVFAFCGNIQLGEHVCKN